MVLLVLALIWAAALLPPLIKSRLEGHPNESIGRFRRHLRVLEVTSPAASSLAHSPVLIASGGSPSSVMPARWAQEARRLRRLRRRQQVARTLLTVMAATVVLGLLPSLRPLLVVHVVADLVFVAYLALLARARKQQVTAHSAYGTGPVVSTGADETIVAPVPTSAVAGLGSSV